MKTISIGIVGMGRIGKIHLTNITRYISQAEVVAVAHANSEAQIYAKQFGVSQFYKNILLWEKHNSGGHFAAMEKPKELASDVNKFVKDVI